MSLETLLAKLDKLSNIEVTQAALAGANVIRDGAKEIVPVDTGDLKNSIIAIELPPDEHGAMVSAGGGDDMNVDYPCYVEFGTSKMEAQPYMRPSIDNNRDAVVRAVGSEIQKNIKEIK